MASWQSFTWKSESGQHYTWGGGGGGGSSKLAILDMISLSSPRNLLAHHARASDHEEPFP